MDAFNCASAEGATFVRLHLTDSLNSGQGKGLARICPVSCSSLSPLLGTTGIYHSYNQNESLVHFANTIPITPIILLFGYMTLCIGRYKDDHHVPVDQGSPSHARQVLRVLDALGHLFLVIFILCISPCHMKNPAWCSEHCI